MTTLLARIAVISQGGITKMNKQYVRNVIRRYRDAYKNVILAEANYSSLKEQVTKFCSKNPPLTRMNINDVRTMEMKTCKRAKNYLKEVQKVFSKCERELLNLIH